MALASHLLWFDAAGAGLFGIESLPSWLEAMTSGRVDPSAVGFVRGERAALALLDGENGIPPLILERAGELAVEKSRDAGVGLVRVANIAPTGSAAAVAARMAIGPVAGLVVGPAGLWSAAFPSANGLPCVVDSALSAEEAGADKKGASRTQSPKPGGPAVPPVWNGLASWAKMLAPEGSWLVAAVAVTNLEPLARFHERLDEWMQGMPAAKEYWAPAAWDARRREAEEHGVVIAAPVWKKLKHWSQRLAVDVPQPGQL